MTEELKLEAIHEKIAMLPIDAGDQPFDRAVAMGEATANWACQIIADLRAKLDKEMSDRAQAYIDRDLASVAVSAHKIDIHDLRAKLEEAEREYKSIYKAALDAEAEVIAYKKTHFAFTAGNPPADDWKLRTPADLKLTLDNYAELMGTAYEQEKALTQARAEVEAERLQREAERTAGADTIETLRMQLVACSTAALQNTEASKAERIDRDNPYWSVAYGDVCAAVDREIERRNEREQARAEAESLTKLVHTAIDERDHYLQKAEKAEAALRDLREACRGLACRTDEPMTQTTFYGLQEIKKAIVRVDAYFTQTQKGTSE